MGVLCTWYEHVQNSEKTFELSKNNVMEYQSLESYICTLSENCLNVNVENSDGAIILNSITKSSRQSSFTVKQISIKEECMKSLLSILDISNPSNIQQRHREGSSATRSATIAKATDAIVIPDNSESEHEITSAKDLWTKCGGISLNRKELQRLTNNKELSDLHINAFQNLLKAQFSSIGGLQNTILQYKGSPLLNRQEKNLQVIHITISQTIKHWAVLEINKDDMIYLYDSAYTSVVGDGKKIIAQLLKTDKNTFCVNIMDVGKQSGATNCGLYAIAILTSLAHGNDPCITVFKKEDLRSHLQQILETRQIKEFPSVQRRKRKSRILSTEIFEVHCICRMLNDGSKMVCCDGCNKWFHAACVKYANNTKKWYCSVCSSMEPSN